MISDLYGTEAMLRPGLIHYVICRTLAEWRTALRAKQLEGVPRRDNALILRPLLIMICDDLRRAGFPWLIDITYKDISDPGVEIATSNTLNKAISEIFNILIERRSVYDANFQLTEEGKEMAHSDPEQWVHWESQAPASRLRIPSDLLAVRAGILLDITRANCAAVTTYGVDSIRNNLIDRAFSLLQENCYYPNVEVAECYQKARRGLPQRFNLKSFLRESWTL